VSPLWSITTVIETFRESLRWYQRETYIEVRKGGDYPWTEVTELDDCNLVATGIR
jgi:hypothetical protein